MNLPKLKLEEYCVIRAEYTTGIILNNDDSYYQSIGENFYRVFENITHAKIYISENIKDCKLKCEYSIYDHDGNFVEIIRQV